MKPVGIEAVPVNRELHSFPKVVIFEIVCGCNLRCVMCPEKQLTRKKGVMSFDLFRMAVTEIANTAPDTEVWATIMGEVFLHRTRVFEYIRFAKRDAHLQKFFLNSNLVLFQEDYMDLLAESGLDKLTVGLDAATAETYNRIRVGGDFERVEKNIEAILSAKARGQLPSLELVLQFIVQDLNGHEEELFKQKWAGRGATLKVRQQLGWGTAVDAPALKIANEDRTVPCPWLMRTMSIHWTGHVAQCDAEWNGDRYVGDLNRQTIKEVWLDQLLTTRKRHLANDFDYEPCRDCHDWQCGRSEFFL
jgi:radical SAM protein with 4Fe4S-binding SPASM domain